MNVDIICPLYEAKSYLRDLHASFLMQEDVDLHEIRYVLTRSSDHTEDILKELGHCTYHVIEKEDFSHSLTREKEAFASKADILVFVTQDIRIRDTHWLCHLIEPLIEKEAEASFSRQICDEDCIEKYVREKNYPAESRVVSREDIPALGLNTFFFSDASSAVLRDVFVSLNGYDQKDFMMNEDMYLAHKLINAGYRIKYCADSVVLHYHKQSLGALYSRYRATGEFFKENPYLNEYGTNESGASLVFHVLKRAWKEGNGKVLLEWLPNMAARYLGMKAGQK